MAKTTTNTCNENALEGRDLPSIAQSMENQIQLLSMQRDLLAGLFVQMWEKDGEDADLSVLSYLYHALVLNRHAQNSMDFDCAGLEVAGVSLQASADALSYLIDAAINKGFESDIVELLHHLGGFNGMEAGVTISQSVDSDISALEDFKCVIVEDYFDLVCYLYEGVQEDGLCVQLFDNEDEFLCFSEDYEEDSDNIIIESLGFSKIGNAKVKAYWDNLVRLGDEDIKELDRFTEFVIDDMAEVLATAYEDMLDVFPHAISVASYDLDLILNKEDFDIQIAGCEVMEVSDFKFSPTGMKKLSDAYHQYRLGNKNLWGGIGEFYLFWGITIEGLLSWKFAILDSTFPFQLEISPGNCLQLDASDVSYTVN